MSAAIACPACSLKKSSVIDSRTTSDGTVRRRRVCAKCKERFTTYERMTDDDAGKLLDQLQADNAALVEAITVLTRQLTEAHQIPAKIAKQRKAA